MITTKAQRKRLFNAGVGYGWLAIKTADNEITEIEIYVGKDNILRRVGNGKPLLPICFLDETGENFECNKAR